MADRGKSSNGEKALLPTGDPMYRMIVGVLIFDVILGLGLSLMSEAVLGIPQLAVVGLGMALIGLVVLGFFIFLGRNANRKGEAARAAPGINPEQE